MSRSPSRAAYAAAILTAGECIHGLEGGDLVRPWTDTPACPLCRGRHPVHWRHLPPDPTPVPNPLPTNVIPLARPRKLF